MARFLPDFFRHRCANFTEQNRRFSTICCRNSSRTRKGAGINFSVAARCAFKAADQSGRLMKKKAE
jgi:hypothetical protein